MIGRRARRRLWRELPVHVFLLLPNLSVLFVLYYLASNALKPREEYYRSEFALPHQLTLNAIWSALNSGQVLIALRNSVVMTTASVVISIALGAFAAYAFARLRVPGKTVIFVAMLVPMSISPLVVSIPLFARLAHAGLIDTYVGGIVVYVGLQLSFAIYVLDGVFREIPDEVIEAARIDGAKSLGVFWRIVLPMALPGLTATSLFVMLAIWNDLLVGLLFVSDPSVIPITASVVTFQQKFSTDPQAIFAGLFLSALPMLGVYAAAQRLFVRGLAAGAFR